MVRMGKKVRQFLLVGLFCLLSIPAAQAERIVADDYMLYEQGLDYSCKTDADCVVKDVHNCCGYYPKCVNKDAQTDSDRVNAYCEKSDIASICGFASISSCSCNEGRCAAKETTGSPLGPSAPAAPLAR